MTKNALLKRGLKNLGMGRPPIIRAMPERKRFFFYWCLSLVCFIDFWSLYIDIVPLFSKPGLILKRLHILRFLDKRKKWEKGREQTGEKRRTKECSVVQRMNFALVILCYCWGSLRISYFWCWLQRSVCPVGRSRGENGKQTDAVTSVRSLSGRKPILFEWNRRGVVWIGHGDSGLCAL